jgi:hypothetical protein
VIQGWLKEKNTEDQKHGKDFSFLKDNLFNHTYFLIYLLCPDQSGLKVKLTGVEAKQEQYE